MNTAVIVAALSGLVLMRFLAKAVVTNRRINADIAYLRASESDA